MVVTADQHVHVGKLPQDKLVLVIEQMAQDNHDVGARLHGGDWLAEPVN